MAPALTAPALMELVSSAQPMTLSEPELAVCCSLEPASGQHFRSSSVPEWPSQ